MISTSAIRDVPDAAMNVAGDLELDAGGSQALVARRITQARPEIDQAQAERLYRIDLGQDLTDDPAGIEEIARQIVWDHGTWAPEIPEQRAELARVTGEGEAAARWDACLAKVLGLLAEDVAGDE